MKASFFGKFTFGASLLLLPLLGSCTPQASSPPSPTVNAPATSNTITAAPDLAVPPTEIASAAESMPADPPTPPPPDPGTVSVAPDGATTAGVLPPYIYPTSPLAQVVSLSQAGVDESIIMAFIANSGGTFNLNSDKIIYLKDIGLPSEIVTAMMQRDQQLLQQLAAASQPASQPAPAETTPETAPAPPPTEPPASESR
jgi:hypothetical protein